MAKPRKPRKPREKQGHFKGMEPPSIREIDAKAEAYVSCRNDRMEMAETELELQADLLALMNKHKLTIYEYDGKQITVAELRKVKVNRKPKEKEDIAL